MLVKTGVSKKRENRTMVIGSLHSFIDHCTFICDGQLVDWDHNQIVDSFAVWYSDIPISFPPKVQEVFGYVVEKTSLN